jgi:hypothetical protein
MISPDLQDCTYTAEVLRTRAASDDIARRIADSVEAPRTIESASSERGDITIVHAFTTASRTYHRTLRRKSEGKAEVLVPRQKTVSGRERFVYDVLVVQRGRHTVLAVPFHGLAEEFFPRVDRVLAGTRTSYERLDITNIVLALGRQGRIALDAASGQSQEIGLTRCHLAYADSAERTRDIQSVQLTGANLGATKQYAFLIAPVLQRATSSLHVMPLVLGFSLYADGVRKASAVTDRHGNFKVFVGAGLRQLVRLLDLLEAVEGMENVVGTTTNLPILQARGIEGETVE